MAAAANRARIIGAILVAVLTGAVIWDLFLQDQLIPKRWGVVEPERIYRSGQLHPALIRRMLISNEIDVIVDLNHWHPEKYEQRVEEQLVEELGIHKYRFPLSGDGTGDPESYVQALAAVHKEAGDGQRVLVHCTAGSQRTGAAVALYRTLLQGASVEEAIAEMERFDFDPDDDAALLQYLDDNMAYISGRLAALGVLSQPPEVSPAFR